ncbi:toprim domain-containing protein [Rhizosphaericola mali]|uniref:Zinc finger CHC2-type domain-containing protein n=1 Tax=Rhizosphaericola mali TaxID=2545455 RepID=A0A5P2FVU7_9BACT|nr:toprim domain-containing protein [Rhizosphaericola mali]QES87636.1 hypothetical protein E0W69_002775 [Rhizosphaericola mali]
MNFQEIKRTPIPSIMEKYGHPIARRSGDALFYFAPWRAENTASVKVSIRDNLFIDYGDEKRCGSVIDLVMNLDNCSLIDASKKLEQIFGITAPMEQPNTSIINVDIAANPSFLINRESDLADKELLSYVSSERGIPIEIAQKYLRELEIEHRIFHKKQIVLGMKNNSGSWEVRGKNGNFKSCIGHKDFTFFDEGFDKVLVVEGMFDLLSAVKLGDKICFEKVNYLVLHSLSNLDRSIPKMLEHNKVFLALDLDFPGRIKTKNLIESDSKFIDLSPKYQMKDGKDLNDFLKYNKGQKRNRGRSL